MKPSDTFTALLCDPEGEVVIGSTEDKRLLKRAIQETKDIEARGRHIHKAGPDGDACALCGHDLRHIIHLRCEEIK